MVRNEYSPSDVRSIYLPRYAVGVLAQKGLEMASTVYM